MSSDTYTLQPGSYGFTFRVGSATVTKTIEVSSTTVITVSVVREGDNFRFSIEGLPSSVGYTCTCPDFTKSRAALPDSSYSSEQADADWTTSQAGADGPCKHVLAVQILRGEVESIPTDVPLPVPKPSKNNPFGKWPKL